jgi:hypothetical protein
MRSAQQQGGPAWAHFMKSPTVVIGANDPIRV